MTTGVGAAPAQAAACNGYVALTFDDGPATGSTMNLLNALKQNGLRATMFNQGQNAAANPLPGQGAGGRGHVGRQPQLHPPPHDPAEPGPDGVGDLPHAAGDRQRRGRHPKLFRPPYGETNSTLKAAAAKYGLTEVIWDVDSQDWNNASTDAIVQAASRLNNGQVILMHDW